MFSPVLTLLDFTKQFIVEANASYKGIGAILIQEGRVIVYFSKAFSEKHLGMPICEKGYLSIINAIDKWRAYPLGRHFIIRTDHQSLKFLVL